MDAIRLNGAFTGHSMAAMITPICDFGWKAVNFELPGVDGSNHSHADNAGTNGTLVMFL